MARWKPNARGRLQQAAMALFLEYGYIGTTVGQIAARAGLTERTFFRYFADKREVLFAGSKELEAYFTGAIAHAPNGASPLAAIAVGLDAIASGLQVPREYAKARHEVIVANPELRERELIKLAGLSAAAATALRDRGVQEPAATLAAEAGIAVFRVGFERWVEDAQPHTLAYHLHAALTALIGVVNTQQA